MSIAIDLPPSVLDEAKGYASFAGRTLEQFLFDCLTAGACVVFSSEAVRC